MRNGQTVILVDPSEARTSVLGARLRMQGYTVIEVDDAMEGARLALKDPPAAVVADLWMPNVSGVQLCRLMGVELSTRNVPVILRGPDGQRNRFWAEHAGAAAYVVKGRMGDLVRALGRAIATTPPAELFWDEEDAHSVDDVRNRIAEHLDQALFESVIAGEIRALGTCAEFERLFDLLSQFVSQLTSYRWLAVSTDKPNRFGLHTNQRTRAVAETEARAALGFDPSTPVVPIEDDDAYGDPTGPAPIVRPIHIGRELVGHLALAVRDPEHSKDALLVEVIARELAGPIRIATLVEESRHLATIDGLTGLLNRRAFVAALDTEVARAERHHHPLSIVLLDVDHFKQVNDTHGHATGDTVLAEVGKLLAQHSRKGDIVARWGGEEFVIALFSTDIQGAAILAERQRIAIEALQIQGQGNRPLSLSASFGAVQLRRGETPDCLVDRADRLMYGAKAAGRNRVHSEGPTLAELKAAAN